MSATKTNYDKYRDRLSKNPKAMEGYEEQRLQYQVAMKILKETGKQ